MAEIKSNIIIDGNYLLMRSVFILKKTRSIHQDLGVLLRKDFDKCKKMHPFDNKFFVSDNNKGKTWRKDFYPEYKGKRKKDDSIDWDRVFDDYSEFKEEISSQRGVQMIDIPKLEGDDIISYIVNESNKKGYSNFIIASDSDLQQLLRYDIANNYMNFIWNYKFSDERIYMPRNYQIFMRHIEKEIEENSSIFDINYDSEFLHMIDMLLNKCKVVEVLGEQILFEKIVGGDGKDNINSLIKLKDKEISEEGIGIGKTGANKCYDIYKDTYGEESINFNSEEFMDNCTEIAAFYKKVNKRPDIKEKIRENVNFNNTLLNLDGTKIPQDLIIKLKNEITFK